jgi:transcriptional regulator with XRE-family HTH domain
MRKPRNKMTDDPVVLRILNELQKQKKTGKDLEQALGLSNGSVSKWKYLGIKSYKNYLDAIAEFLDISVEELQNGFEEDQELSVDEICLIEMYRKLSADEQCYLKQTIKYMLDLSELRKYREMETGNESQSDENPLS